MKLSVREAATLLGRSPRTVRAQLVRGDLPGRKHNGQWRIERRHLPLTEAQRSALQEKADSIRRTVEEALPSRMARNSGQRSRSIADLDSFRRGAEVLAEIRAATGDDLREPARERVSVLLDGALLALAEGVQLFDRERHTATGTSRTRPGTTSVSASCFRRPEPAAGAGRLRAPSRPVPGGRHPPSARARPFQ